MERKRIEEIQQVVPNGKEHQKFQGPETVVSPGRMAGTNSLFRM